ncbi:hypothetical protein Tco_0978690, partial [Tanacetum coccineum]
MHIVTVNLLPWMEKSRNLSMSSFEAAKLDMLKNAPMFKRLEARIKGKSSALGVGRGRAVAMRARAQAAGRGAAAGSGRGRLTSLCSYSQLKT